MRISQGPQFGPLKTSGRNNYDLDNPDRCRSMTIASVLPDPIRANIQPNFATLLACEMQSETHISPSEILVCPHRTSPPAVDLTPPQAPAAAHLRNSQTTLPARRALLDTLCRQTQRWPPPRSLPKAPLTQPCSCMVARSGSKRKPDARHRRKSSSAKLRANLLHLLPKHITVVQHAPSRIKEDFKKSSALSTADVDRCPVIPNTARRRFFHTPTPLTRTSRSYSATPRQIKI